MSLVRVEEYGRCPAKSSADGARCTRFARHRSAHRFVDEEMLALWQAVADLMYAEPARVETSSGEVREFPSREDLAVALWEILPHMADAVRLLKDHGENADKLQALIDRHWSLGQEGAVAVTKRRTRKDFLKVGTRCACGQEKLMPFGWLTGHHSSGCDSAKQAPAAPRSSPPNATEPPGDCRCAKSDASGPSGVEG